MHHLKFKFLATALVLVCLLVTGCAVLTVDVDVYKGPLSNTEQVQGDQAISLAMGAKPLLVNLRDQLEAASKFGNWALIPQVYPYTQVEDVLMSRRMAQTRSQPWYAADYIPPYDALGNTNKTYSFQNPLAVQLNDILSLYKDQAPAVLTAPLAEAENLADQYRQQFHILSIANPGEDIKFWNKIKPQINVRVMTVTNAGASNDTGASTDHVSDAGKVKPVAASTKVITITNDISNLIGEYDNFFSRSNYPSASDGTFVYWVVPQVPVISRSSVAENQSTNGAIQTTTNLNLVETANLNSSFDSLLEGQAETDAQSLFGSSNSPKKTAFLEKVNAIARAHFEARGDLQKLFRTVLSMIPTARRQNLALTGFQDAAAHLVAPMISANRLLHEMQANNDQALITKWSKTLSGLPGGPDLAGIEANAYSGADAVEQRGSVTESVYRLLADDDGRLIYKFLEYDRQLSDDGQNINRFGLVLGWVDLSPSLLQPLMDNLTSVTGDSLGQGRPVKGIETLINDYDRQTAENQNPLAWPTNEVFQSLMDGLAQFGNKVATLGNGAELMKITDVYGSENYTLILQSVGNSIVVQIDELKARAAHQQDLLNKSRLFGEALNQAGGFTNAGLENWPSTNVPPGVQLDAKDAAEQLQNVLRAEYLKAIHQDLGATVVAKPVKTSHLLASTNLVLFLKFNDQGMATNASILSPNFSSGTDHATQIIPASGSRFNLVINSPHSVAGTNIILNLEVSTNGDLINALVKIQSGDGSNALTVLTPPTVDNYTNNAVYLNLLIATNETVATYSIFSNSVALNVLSTINLSVNPVNVSTNTNPPANSPVLEDKYLAAIREVTDLRAGMIYLRPAASYLRSSFTASAALDNQGDAWHNMLEEQAWRNTPFLPALWDQFHTDNSRQIMAELDKQSWQNINRVRVAGGFDVNYVLVKDDIGNWYVKSFTDNPTNFFTSLTGLAQYAAGGSIPMLAKGALTNAASMATAAAASSAANLTNGVLSAEFNLITSNYMATSATIYSQAFKSAAGLHDNITNQTTWANLLLDVTTNLTAGAPDTVASNTLSAYEINAFAPLTNVLTAAANSVTNIDLSSATNGNTAVNFASIYSQQTVNILNAVGAYSTSLTGNIQGNSTITNRSWTQVTAFLSAETKIVAGIQTGNLNQQTNALGQCQQGINLISRMATGN